MAWWQLLQWQRLIVLALCGAASGSFVNWAIYSWAWFHPRATSPWSGSSDKLQRTWLDCVPLYGWWRLRRESDTFGAFHWVRPLLIELGLAIFLPLLYLWEIDGRLIPLPPFAMLKPTVSHTQFLAHVLLLIPMLIATFIDFDEQTIPDIITIPGTLLALVFVTCFPTALPLVVFFPEDPRATLEPLWFTSSPWPVAGRWENQWPGLLLGCLCFTGWCYALIPKTCTLRRGWIKGLLYLHASTWRRPAGVRMAILAVVGVAAITGVFWQQRGLWPGLLTSLVGMAYGAGLIWSVRIVGYLGLRKEAMGFGDVTLMGMICAFLGWQTSILIFFTAPLAAVVIAVAQKATTGRHDIAFGPYLCGGALILILNWPWYWSNYGFVYVALGSRVHAFLFCGLLFMLGLLMFWRIGEQLLFGGSADSSKSSRQD